MNLVQLFHHRISNDNNDDEDDNTLLFSYTLQQYPNTKRDHQRQLVTATWSRESEEEKIKKKKEKKDFKEIYLKRGTD